jgi:hypothetical protein
MASTLFIEVANAAALSPHLEALGCFGRAVFLSGLLRDEVFADDFKVAADFVVAVLLRVREPFARTWVTGARRIG